MLYDQTRMECMPNMIKNSQENAVLACQHVILGNMVHMDRLKGKNNLDSSDIEQFIIDAV